MGRWKERKGRRWFYSVDTRTGETCWIAWRLFERVEGIASSEEYARDAIAHFLESPGASYSQRA